MLSTWWLFPFLGILTVLTGSQYQHAGDPGSSVVPYYRFMNATAAPIALVGLGAFVAVRFFLRWGRRRAGSGAASDGAGLRRVVAAIAALAVILSLGWVLVDGLNHRWVSEKSQWVDEAARTSLAAVHVVSEAAGERPNILVMNYNDQDDNTQSNTAYGWAKTFTNVFRTGLPGTSAAVRRDLYGHG